MIPKPPKLSDLKAGTKLVAGLSTSTIMADIDFETYSPAGFVWNQLENCFDAPQGSNKKGLPGVGAAVYTEHPDAEVLSCAYNLKDGLGSQLWNPNLEPPISLFDHVRSGGLLEAWNSSFEYWVWMNICFSKYGWPHILNEQFRCAKSKAAAFAIPCSLEDAGNILNIENKKDKEGKRLLNKFSIPRNPTKKDPRWRIHPFHDIYDSQNIDVKDTLDLYAYNLRDIEAEAEISSLIPDLTASELEFWLCDQAINFRGVQIDKEVILSGIAIVESVHKKYKKELFNLTKGKVSSASEIQKLRNWMMEYGVSAPNLKEESVIELLKITELPTDVRRALEIRQLISSAAVKKLYAMINRITKKGRIHDLFIYHSARTGRAAGTGAQPQNLPNSGLEVSICASETCHKHFSKEFHSCPWCGCYSVYKNIEWNSKAVNDAIETIRPGSLGCVEYFFKDAIATISGCLRGLFISAPGHDLICSDYSAIEAVVLAALASEEWQMEVFRTHGKIYEMTASKITGIPFEEFMLHKGACGQHHPSRKIGKVASLASGYGSWLGGWKAFHADEFLNDEEIKKSILAWREASPSIVEMWGGQPDWRRNEYYGLEGAAIQAVLNAGTKFNFKNISYLVHQDILYCQLLSGRYLVYHKPRLSDSDKRPGTYSLSFEGWNTNPKNGGMGWIRMNTYGGKLTENVVQATARDILAHAVVNLEKSKYPVVLHIHDEIVSEIPENWGSVSEFEEIMSKMPEWAEGWPIKATGGWRAKRYAK